MRPNWEKENQSKLDTHQFVEVHKITNTVDEQCEDRVRKQLAIDPTADTDHQQRANGRNLKDNTRVGDKIMEFNIPCAQTELRMNMNFTLLNSKQGTNCETLQDDRHPRYNFYAQERGLDVHVGYNICFQPFNVQRVRERCEMQIQNQADDIISIRRDGMDNQSEQVQTRSQEINKIPGMELESGINDAIDNQVNEEIGDGIINQIGAVDTFAKVISNRKKRNKVDWTNPIYKSLIHTRRSSYHFHESGNEQTSKEGRMEKP
ncbi:MAG: hypothetical protein EZS28_037971, partial [Streblomastix strix]